MIKLFCWIIQNDIIVSYYQENWASLNKHYWCDSLFHSVPEYHGNDIVIFLFRLRIHWFIISTLAIPINCYFGTIYRKFQVVNVAFS